VKYRNFSLLQFSDGLDLLNAHFDTWVRRDDQQRREGLAIAIVQLREKPARIIETGTSAWGIDSTRLFDGYVRRFGGRFWTLDIRSEPSQRLASQLCDRTTALVGDSVKLLEGLNLSEGKIDLVYLDSWDLDWSEPGPSAAHCLSEWQEILPMCGPGTLVLIDDTPKSLDFVPDLNPSWRLAASKYLSGVGRLPGKGELVLQEVKTRDDVQILFHGYSLLVQFV